MTDTTISSTVRTTSATSPSGSETSFQTTSKCSNAQSFPLGENFRFETTRMVASNINETNELSGARSMFVDLEFILQQMQMYLQL